MNSRKKIAFFFKKQQAVGGSLIFFFKLASYLAEQGEYEVLYFNLPNIDLEEGYLSESVQTHYMPYCDFNVLEDADIIVPFNHVISLLTYIKGVKTGRILLYNWQPDATVLLRNQLYYKNREIAPLLELFCEKDAVAFMAESDRVACNKWIEGEFNRRYVPVFPSENNDYSLQHALHGINRVSIGWMSRLDTEKIYSLINMLEAIRSDDTIEKVDLHIIGDGPARNKINIQRYSSKVRFIFTSFLFGEERDQYFLDNVDIAVTMGVSALDTGMLGIPTVVPSVMTRPFEGNRFVYLFDVKDYSLGWSNEDLDLLGLETHTIGEVIRAVYSEEGKKEIGAACLNYCKDNYSIEKTAQLMVSALQNSQLTQEDCRNNSVLNAHLTAFQNYRKLRRGRDYDIFVTFIRKVNQIQGKSLFKKIKILTSIACNPIKKKIGGYWGKIVRRLKLIGIRRKNLKYFNAIQNSYQEKAEIIKKVYENTGKIKVAHLVILNASFPTRPIFEEMLKDSAFDPYIIVVPDVQRSIQYRNVSLQNTYDELANQYGERVLYGYDPLENTYLELGEEYQLVCFNNPYRKMAHKYHHIAYFTDKNVLTLYVNYGFAAVKYGRAIMDTNFYNLCWKVCIDSPINLRDLKKHHVIKGRNAFVTSYLKMDRYALAPLHHNRRKTIIISPHHTVLGWDTLDISNFLAYSDFFLELPKRYPDIDFVFRPHPLLFNNLLEGKRWTQKRIDNYLSSIEQIPNIRYDCSGDYFEVFANSDGMIHDCSSFIGEYLFTEKPCCYMLKSKKEIKEVMNPMGVACMNNYYKAFSKEDILRFIDDVIIGGIDPLKERREKFSREELKFNYPHAAESVINMIKDTLDIETTDGGK